MSTTTTATAVLPQPRTRPDTPAAELPRCLHCARGHGWQLCHAGGDGGGYVLALHHRPHGNGHGDNRAG